MLDNGKRTDVVSLMQAQMVTVDMVPDNPGIWMFHCHIDDHMEARNGHAIQGRAVSSWEHEEEIPASFSE